MLSPFFLLLLLTNLLSSVQSICQNNNGNYTTNSTYANNLNTVLSSLPESIDAITGFRNASLGQAPDRAYAIALCRADAQPQICRSCIQNITADLLAACPYQRQAVDWSDFCMLRCSNESMFGTSSTSPQVFMWNVLNATNPVHFNADMRWHLDRLGYEAAAGGSLKVAAGNVTANDFQYIFALVQCTPDLSAEDCSSCLIDAARYVPIYCDRRRGCRVLSPSCYLRYETYSFYNATRLRELVSVPPLPPPEPPVAPPPPVVSPPGTNSGNNTAEIVIIIVVLVVACVIIAVFICNFRKRMKRKPVEEHETIVEMGTAESLKYALSTIRAATNDFSIDNKLGQGGFGPVYKGKLSNGQEIAVKRLSKNSGQGEQEFKNEVLLVVKLQHRNLVRLLGFCLEGIEKLLVYEFVQNASLDRFIFDPVKSSNLDWDRRYKIIGGIARGLLYLHEDSRLRIIHRDLKTSNVLLDGEMNPKIADFGMARLFGQDETEGSRNRIVGTYGYMSPEYAMHGQFSVKSDVFSFGVLVLEIMSGQKNIFIHKGNNVEDLLSFTWKNWREGTAANAIDPVLRAGKGPLHEMLRCVHIGLLCVQENPADRPTMASVVQMLNSFSIALPVASEPAFFMHVSTESNSGRALLKDKTVVSEGLSQNEMSVTQLYPR